MAKGVTTDVYPRDNCIAPDIAFIVWTTGEQQQRNITGGINLNSLPNINAVLACGVRMDFSGKPRNAITGSHLLVRRTVHCSARSASHRRSKGRFGARQKPSSACATSSTGATGAACAADAAADPRRYLRAVGRRHRAQATAGRPTCSYRTCACSTRASHATRTAASTAAAI